MNRARAWLFVLGVAILLPSTAAAQAPLPDLKRLNLSSGCTGYMAPRPPSPPPGGPADGPGWEYRGIYDGIAEGGAHVVDVGARVLAGIVPAPAIVVHDRARGALMWSVSFALDGERDRGCWRIPHHRVVAEAGTVFGAGFASRLGYRYVVQPARSPLGVSLGLGAQLTDFDHVRRVTVSPETGLRLGYTERPGALSLLMRREIPFDGPVREGAWWFLLGVSFF